MVLDASHTRSIHMIAFMSREKTHFGFHSEVTARRFLPLLSLCLSLLSVGFRSVLLFSFLFFLSFFKVGLYTNPIEIIAARSFFSRMTLHRQSHAKK